MEVTTEVLQELQRIKVERALSADRKHGSCSLGHHGQAVEG